MDIKMIPCRAIRFSLYACAFLSWSFLGVSCSPVAAPTPAPKDTPAAPATHAPPAVTPAVTPTYRQPASNAAATRSPVSRPPESPIAAYTEAVQRGQISQLLEQGQIEIRVHGSGIDEIDLEISKFIQEILEVEIPAGTLFISQDASTQNMVVRRTKIVRLENNNWLKFTLEVACANMERKVPNAKDEFSLASQPKSGELAALMPVLESAKMDYDVQQAAIWIITDNSNYADLGTLVVRSVGGLGGVRAIDQDDAVRAMRLVSEAGIDIKSKAIWGDRREIIAAVKDVSLAMWLSKMIKEEAGRPASTLAKPAASRPVILVANPDCPAPGISTADDVIVRVRWGATTPALAEANADHFSFVFRLDGVDQGDIRLYRQLAETYSSLERYGCGHGEPLGWVHWDVLLGRLPAGNHTIAVNYILDEAISDGLDEYGPGPFGFLEVPFEIQP